MALPGDVGERYEHVGTLAPTPRYFRGVYQFTNEPTLVHLVEWDAETTLCGLARDAFDELDPVFQVDEFPSCDECRDISDLRIIEGIIRREASLREQAIQEANRTDSPSPPEVISDVMARVHEGLNAMRDAIIAGDRAAYLEARRTWQLVEIELDELLPQKPETPV
jgi:hypothetical protein